MQNINKKIGFNVAFNVKINTYNMVWQHIRNDTYNKVNDNTLNNVWDDVGNNVKRWSI